MVLGIHSISWWEVFLGDKKTHKIISQGKVKLVFNDGRVKTLIDVLHILGLARQLINISKT